MLNIFAVGTHNVHQDSQEDMEFDPRDPFLSDLKFSNDFDIKSGRPMADSKYVNLANNIPSTCSSELQKVAET